MIKIIINKLAFLWLHMYTICMKIIKTHSKNKKENGNFIVDDEDYKYLKLFKFYNHKGYARCTSGYGRNRQGKYMMHLLVAGTPPDGMEIDHINQNVCDNRKSNLRFVNHSDQMKNRKPYGKSKYKNVHIVCKIKGKNYYACKPTIKGKQVYIGAGYDADRLYKKYMEYISA